MFLKANNETRGDQKLSIENQLDDCNESAFLEFDFSLKGMFFNTSFVCVSAHEGLQIRVHKRHDEWLRYFEAEIFTAG